MLAKELSRKISQAVKKGYPLTEHQLRILRKIYYRLCQHFDIEIDPEVLNGLGKSPTASIAIHMALTTGIIEHFELQNEVAALTRIIKSVPDAIGVAIAFITSERLIGELVELLQPIINKVCIHMDLKPISLTDREGIFRVLERFLEHHNIVEEAKELLESFDKDFFELCNN